MGGRECVAWFSKDIPLNEGPYKFRGLPGLIFEILDTRNQFIFKLIKSYQLENTYSTLDFLEIHGNQKPLLISEEKLEKIKINFFKDPFHEIRKGFVYTPDESIRLMGVRIKSKDQIDEATKKFQNFIIRNNNQLEKNNIIDYSSIK